MRSIDLQDNLSKAPLAGREQGIQQSSADLGQRPGAQALNRQHVLDQTRTSESEKSERADNRVDDPPDDGRNNQHGDRQHAEDDAGGPAEATERQRPSATSREIDLMA